MSFLIGSPGGYERVSNLEKSQQPLYNQLQQAAGAGSFGPAADYYRQLLSDQDPTYSALSAPLMRQFKEEIFPDIAEQFAGMGSGALSSSGFQQQASRAGTDLSERLASLRAQLRGQGAQGLMGLGQFGLQSFGENVYRPQEAGLLQYLTKGIGEGIGSLGGSAGISSLAKGFSNIFGSSDPYGGKAPLQRESVI